MKAAKTTCTVFTVLAVVLGLCAGILCYADLMTGYDVSIGHFNGSTLTTLMVAAFIAAPVCALIAGLSLIRRASSVGMPKYGLFQTVTSMLCAAAFAALGVAEGIFPIWRAVAAVFVYDVPFIEKIKGVFQYLYATSQHLSTIAGILALLCAVCFILFSGEKKTEKARSGLSLFAVVWALLESLVIYFDKTRTINSPVKSLLLLGSVAVMMFLCEEVRFYIGDQCAPLYGFVCAGAASVGLAVYLPGTVIAVMRVMEEPTSRIFGSVEGIYRAIGLDVFHMAVGLAVTLFAISRLSGFAGTLGEYVPKKKEEKKSADGEAKASDDDEAVAKADEASDDAEATEVSENAEETADGENTVTDAKEDQ